MNDRLKGDPGNQEAWDLGLPIGHFSVIPGHLLSLGCDFILLESEEPTAPLNSDILDSVEDTGGLAYLVSLSSPFGQHSPFSWLW